MDRKYKFIIGIDTGKHTGVAVYDVADKKMIVATTLKIHEAFVLIDEYYYEFGNDIFVRFEDARQRKWFGLSDREKLQGAGSVKRDSAIWQDFLTDKGIAFEAVPPKNNKTKLSEIAFRQITGYHEKTSEHGRDAAMLCFGY